MNCAYSVLLYNIYRFCSFIPSQPNSIYFGGFRKFRPVLFLRQAATLSSVCQRDRSHRWFDSCCMSPHLGLFNGKQINLSLYSPLFCLPKIHDLLTPLSRKGGIEKYLSRKFVCLFGPIFVDRSAATLRKSMPCAVCIKKSLIENEIDLLKDRNVEIWNFHQFLCIL